MTLATMNICRGLAYVYTGGSPVRVMTDAWKFIGAGYIGPFPTPVIIMIAILIITAIIMNRQNSDVISMQSAAMRRQQSIPESTSAR